MRGDALPAYPSRQVPMVFVALTLVIALGATGSAADAVPTPPATYYGQALPGPGFVPTAGMAVSAWIGGHPCGQGVTIAQQELIVYAIDVVGEGPGGSDGCGAPGRVIVFQIATQYMGPTAPWDNSQLHNLPLQPMRPPMEPVVSIEHSEDDLVLSWPQVTLDTSGNATLVTHYRIWRGTRPYFDPDQLPCNCVHIADVPGLSYTDSDVGPVDLIGDVNTNYAYVVKAVNAIGESAASGAVGEFDYALAPGSP